MKQKFLMLLAVVLLSCASAFAQNGNNNPLKGDVNEDGKVDVADIAAVINIMKNGGGTTDGKLYFYVGTEKPTSLSQATIVNSYPAEQTYTNNSGKKSHIFVLTNSDKAVEFINPELSAPVSQVDVDITTIPGYKIFETAVGCANTGSIIIRITEAPVYYFYVGTEKPTSLSQATVVDSYPAEQTYTNNSGKKSHIFVLTNSDKTVEFINLATNNPVDQFDVDSTSISGYKIFETAVGTANGGSIKIRISEVSDNN